MKTSRLKIAIQKKGRLNQASMEFLRSLGLRFAANGYALLTECENFDLDVLLLRDDDIPEYVSRGVVDFGILGENVLFEKQAGAQVLRRLNFGKCRLMIAVPKNSGISDLKGLEGERIATSYPRLLGEYLRRNDIDAAVIPITGSVEITPELNLADAVCDLVQTGNTLRAHDLTPLLTVLESQAVLIESPFRKAEKSGFIDKFALASMP